MQRSEAWDLKPLGALFERISRRNRAGVTRVLTASGDRGLIDQAEFFNKNVAGADLSNYLHLKRGEFAYNRSAMNGYPVGAVKRLDRYAEGVVSSLYLCFGIRENGQVDGDFAAQVFGSTMLEEDLRPIVKVGARAHGLLNVSADDFMSIRFPLPPLPEQKKIAAILSSVDEAIQATQAVIHQTRRVKAGLLQDLLTRGIGHTRFKQTEIGEIPEGWSLSQPGKLADFSGGYGFRPPDWGSEGLPIIRIQNLNGSQDFNHYAGDVLEKWLVPPGQLLFAWAGTAGASFGPCLWPGPLGVLNQHIFKIEPRTGVNKQWLCAVLRLITHRIERRAHGFKSTLLHVHKADITDQVVPLPPPAEQTRIAERAAEIEKVIERAEAGFRALVAVKSALLQDLLTGRVRVTP
jgi:type I restriction enzyme S subunit